MPKSLMVNPADLRKSGTLTLPSIPMNRYTRDFPSEIAAHGEEGLVAMLHDMIAVREFESMLNAIKTTGAWNGVEYNHKGPAHLSIGQEAAVVGQAAALEPEDFIFGSHRSHGEILAKCYSASRKLPPASLEAIMRGFLDGETLRYAERVAYGSLAALAENFILFGTVAEIFARKSGFTRGLGGSMHAFFAPFGSMPNNAIVGGSADIHYQKGMTCLECHGKMEFHGTGSAYTSKKEVKEKPACTGCHKTGTEKTEKAKSSHVRHRDKVSCYACHSGGMYTNCYDCHLGKGATPRPGFFLGLDHKDKKTVTTLRITPAVRDTFKSAGIIMEKYDSLPNYRATAAHNIKKRTDRTRSCEVCHVEKKNFLTKEMLIRNGSRANELLLYSPKPIDKGDR